jgi:hypothetical protein
MGPHHGGERQGVQTSATAIAANCRRMASAFLVEAAGGPRSLPYEVIGQIDVDARFSAHIVLDRPSQAERRPMKGAQ